MLEAELRGEVMRLLQARPSLRWHLCQNSRQCAGPQGWPDLAIVGRELLLRELKGTETRTRRHQLSYGRQLVAAGVSWAVWRPADLESGRIEAELDDVC